MKIIIKHGNITVYNSHIILEVANLQTILTELERLDRLVEQKIETEEEFRKENCNHRCVLNSQIIELSAELEHKDKVIEVIIDELFDCDLYQDIICRKLDEPCLSPANNGDEGCRKCIRLYFENKAKEN